MRILFLNPIGKIGGGERVLLLLISTIRKADPTSTIGLFLLEDGPLAVAARNLGVEVEVTSATGKITGLGDSQVRGKGLWGKVKLMASAVPMGIDLLRLVRKLKKAIVRFKPDVIHSNGIKTHLLSRFCCPKDSRLVWHIHDFFSLRPLGAKLLAWTRGKVSAAIAISNAVAKDAETILKAVPITVIPNGVDLERFAPESGGYVDLDQQAGLPRRETGTVCVGLIATYARWKGQLTFLESAARVLARFPASKLRWYIIGGPIYSTAAQFSESELRDEVEARHLIGKVGFIPFSDDTPSLYRALDIVVHASTLPEPFGLTIAEAMACGRAVVVSAAGGAKELFTEGVDAVGFEPGNAEQLGTVVIKLAEDSQCRSRIGQAARSTAASKFDSERNGRQIMELYNRLLGKPG